MLIQHGAPNHVRNFYSCIKTSGFNSHICGLLPLVNTGLLTFQELSEVDTSTCQIFMPNVSINMHEARVQVHVPEIVIYLNIFFNLV